jgi:hypothetical protein
MFNGTSQTSHTACEGSSQTKFEGSPRQKELQGNKMYTPDEIEQKQLKIDYLYYLEKQIVPALDDLLEILGPESYLKRFHKLLVQNPH